MKSPMILVVGDGPYKASTAAVLSRRGYDVKETTDIEVSDTLQILTDARKWISQNSLRRLDGQNVKELCCLAAEGSHDHCGWVAVMCLVFKGHFQSVAAILQSNSVRYDEDIEGFLSSQKTNSTVVETMNDDCGPQLTQVLNSLREPFNITSGKIKKDMLKAWSSEKVILFGRTGAGKSTIAQMLTLGVLNVAESGGGSKVEASSSARGDTKDIFRGEGRGWHVKDTPGFGEAKSGTVSTSTATKIIKKFVIAVGGMYSHFIYVVKEDGMNVCDERLWKFFNKIFAAAEDNFCVVVTGCTSKLSAENESHLQKTFEGCKNFIYVDFPPICAEDPDLEEENQDVREESLQVLEDGLARLGVADLKCTEGMFSKEALKFHKSDLRSTLFNDCTGLGVDLAVGAFNLLFIKPVAAGFGLFRKSEIDESFILLPQ